LVFEQCFDISLAILRKVHRIRLTPQISFSQQSWNIQTLTMISATAILAVAHGATLSWSSFCDSPGYSVVWEDDFDGLSPPPPPSFFHSLLALRAVRVTDGGFHRVGLDGSVT
jgi:hypothetical protein